MIKKIKSIIKKIYYGSPKFKKQGENAIFSFSNSSFSYDRIELGNNVFIGSKAQFSGTIRIGNNVMFGPGVTIMGGDHLFGIKGQSVRFLKPLNNENNRDVMIEDEVWCGANVTILKGVILGMGCVVGAGSVVTRAVPPYTVAVGNPTRCVKKIFPDVDLLEHLNLIGFNYEVADQIVRRRNKELKKYGIEQLTAFVNTSR